MLSLPQRRATIYDPEATPVSAYVLDAALRITIRHYRDSRAEVDQPPLPDHIVSIHLGGPKRISRTAHGSSSVRNVDVGALTILPSMHAYHWRTEGPVEFAHLTLPAALLHRVALEEFDSADPALSLRDNLGFRAPLVEQAMLALLADLGRGQAGALYRDGLLTAIAYILLRDHSSLSPKGAGPRRLRGGLTPRVLARVVSYMDAHLADEILPAQLIALTGLSRAQFYRAFKQSTGLSPGAYLATLRRSRAATLRAQAGLSGEAAALLTGMRYPS